MPASAIWTGNCPIPPARSWPKSGRFVTRLPSGWTASLPRCFTNPASAAAPEKRDPDTIEIWDLTTADAPTSHLGSQHVELTARRGGVEAVLNEPSGRHQTPPRPPGADYVAVDVGAVAGDEVAEVL